MDLIIGNTSQLAQYWREIDPEIEIISSRNIDVKAVQRKKYDRIYFAFSDGRTYLTDWAAADNFTKANVKYPIWLIEQLQDYCTNIIFYSTTELWNEMPGPLNLRELINSGLSGFEHTFFYKSTPYIVSKATVTQRLFQGFLEGKYLNTIVLFPYSFNSPIRKEQGFLFLKVFDSIVNKKKIAIGDTYYYRELLHPRFVIRQSRTAWDHQIIGSGRVTHVNDFIRNLYIEFGMDYDEYVTEDLSQKFRERGTNWLGSKECLYTYDELFQDTIFDLWKMRQEANNG